MGPEWMSTSVSLPVCVFLPCLILPQCVSLSSLLAVQLRMLSAAHG